MHMDMAPSRRPPRTVPEIARSLVAAMLWWRSRRLGAVLTLLPLLLGLPVPVVAGELAGEQAGIEDDLAEIRQLIEALEERLAAGERQELQTLRRELADLKQRLAALEARLQEADGEETPPPDVDAQIEALRQEAAAAAGPITEDATGIEEQRRTAGGRQRAQQAFNPEISFLGDVSYDWTDTGIDDQFVLRAAEVSFQSALDPYTRFKAFLAAHEEPPELDGSASADEDDEINVNLEEAYIDWIALPANMSLRVGRFRQQFGTLNRWHQHALPSTDLPFALRNIFGHEGLQGTGLQAEWQIPGLWATANSFLIEVVDPDNDSAFGGRTDDPEILLRFTNFFDLGEEGYFEMNLNGVTGPHDEDDRLDTSVASTDFNFIWEPEGKARYRGLELRGEFLYTWFETATDGTIESQSFYTYLMWKASQRWGFGLRYDNAELPWDRFELQDGQLFQEGLREKGWTPIVSFWQSEYVRLRFQYQHASRDFTAAHGGDDDDRLWVQVTFAAGPHKHEEY